MDNRFSMKVFQIALDYVWAPLYKNLFNELEKIDIKEEIFCPVSTKYKEKCNGDYPESVKIAACFNEFERRTFYLKQRKTVRYIKENFNLRDITVLHAHTLFSAGYTAMKLKDDNNIPYLVAVRNSDVNVFFKRMKHLRSTGIEILRKAEKVIFLSPAYKRTVLETYVPDDFRNEIEKKSIVIPNGISDFFLDNRASNEKGLDRARREESCKIKIIYAGEINQNKNLTETIEACKILMRKGYKCTFTIVGDVTDKSCEKILHENFINHYPRCGHDELIKYYRNNDIFVMPSHTETFGLVYAEAMSQGLPVIYTRGQGFDGQFAEGDVGYSVSDKDAEELAEKIEMVAKDYEAMSKKCVGMVSRFDWKSIAKEYKSIYNDILLQRV